MNLLFALLVLAQSNAKVSNSNLNSSIVVGEVRAPLVMHCADKGMTDKDRRLLERIDRNTRNTRTASEVADQANRERKKLEQDCEQARLEHARDIEQKQREIDSLQAQINRSDEQDTEGAQLLMARRYDEGIALYRRAIADGRENVTKQAARHSIVAKALLASGSGDAAIHDFAEAYRLDPTNLFFAIDYSKALKRSGREDEANKVLTRHLSELSSKREVSEIEAVGMALLFLERSRAHTVGGENYRAVRQDGLKAVEVSAMLSAFNPNKYRELRLDSLTNAIDWEELGFINGDVSIESVLALIHEATAICGDIIRVGASRTQYCVSRAKSAAHFLSESRKSQEGLKIVDDVISLLSSQQARRPNVDTLGGEMLSELYHERGHILAHLQRFGDAFTSLDTAKRFLYAAHRETKLERTVLMDAQEIEMSRLQIASGWSRPQDASLALKRIFETAQDYFLAHPQKTILATPAWAVGKAFAMTKNVGNTCQFWRDNFESFQPTFREYVASSFNSSCEGTLAAIAIN